MAQTGLSNIIPQVRLVAASEIKPERIDLVHRKLSLTYRFFAVCEGSCRLILDGEELTLNRSDIVYLVPGQEYTTIFKADETFKNINICFDFFPSESSASSDFLIPVGDGVPDSSLFRERYDFTDMPELSTSTVISGLAADERFAELRELYLKNDPISRLRLSARFTEFLADFAKSLETRRNSDGKRSVTAILDYIDAHIYDKITCRTVAEHFGYHPSSCSRIVHAYTGVTMHEYIIKVKLRAVDRLLLETDLQIGVIAFRLGFNDSSHLSSVYQAYTGMKPNERRRKFRSNITDDRRKNDAVPSKLDK